MSHLSAMYATKRRRRNSKSVRPNVAPGLAKDISGHMGSVNGVTTLANGNQTPSNTKSNPSKRHRERLNAELDTLASLLPFDQSVLSKLDKLSILRLSVSYLRTKSYFQASQAIHNLHPSKPRDMLYIESLVEGDLILQALNGFLLILTCEGEVFFASHTVETYLGFHQSDICHQSVYELVHSEDREDLQRYLMWNSQLPTDRSNLSLQQMLQSPDLQRHLDRNFTVRFRCLLDNTSGFLRLDIQGRIKVLHGQNHKTEDPPLALFAVCTPFGPPSLLEMPQKESMFKSKHKLDLSLVSMDSRGKHLLGYSDQDISNMRGGYDLVHHDDLAYVASAHQELLKTGASGLIAYRLCAKDNSWQWLQTSTRLVYKNSKPDFILCTHRPLMDEEGRDLLGKRTMDFKVTYLDTGLNQLLNSSSISSSPDTPPLTDTRIETTEKPQRRKYKTKEQSNNTTTKKKPKVSSPDVVVPCTPTSAYHLPTVETDTQAYNSMYSYAHPAEISSYASQNLFLDNSRSFHFTTPDFLHYRHLGSYYPSEYPQYSPFSGTPYVEAAKEVLDANKYTEHTTYNSGLLSSSSHLPLLPEPPTTLRVKSPASPIISDSRQGVLMWGTRNAVAPTQHHQISSHGVSMGVTGQGMSMGVGMGYGVGMGMTMDNELPPPAYTADMVTTETAWHHQEVTTPWRPHLPTALG